MRGYGESKICLYENIRYGFVESRWGQYGDLLDPNVSNSSRVDLTVATLEHLIRYESYPFSLIL